MFKFIKEFDCFEKDGMILKIIQKYKELIWSCGEDNAA